MTAGDFLRRERDSRLALKIGTALAVFCVVVWLASCGDHSVKSEPVFNELPPRMTVDVIARIWSDSIILLTDHETGVVCYFVQPKYVDSGRAIWCMPPHPSQPERKPVP